MTKKVRTVFLAIAVVSLSLFLLSPLNSLLLTKLKLHGESEVMSTVTVTEGSSLILVSEIFENLSLHLDDVEFLRNAFAAQALVGPLVRFSNRGRYEPYVAKRWSQSGDSWIFELHHGLTCEDGQAITPESFKSSLKRSLRRFSQEEINETPFAHLNGIEALLMSNDDSNLGVISSGDELKLEFRKPVGKALLEYLAMTPFAFLCESNFEGDKWRSREKFISSGPYKVHKFNSESNLCELQLRRDWVLNESQTFEKVILTKKRNAVENPTAIAEVTYSLAKSENLMGLVREVPRALLSLRLGIEQGQFFSDRQHRLVLKAAIDKILDATEIPLENYHRAESFFFGQLTGHEQLQSVPKVVLAPKAPLKIRARPTGASSDVDFYQNILFKALSELGWPYELMEAPIKSVKDFYNTNYDVAFDRSHVDATLDPEFVRLLFKSKLGPKFQDPGHRVSKLVDEFDKGSMAYRDFLISFNAIISEEAAIIPMFHRGFTWKFSPNIDVQSISPLMSILRYEELKMKTNDH